MQKCGPLAELISAFSDCWDFSSGRRSLDSRKASSRLRHVCVFVFFFRGPFLSCLSSSWVQSSERSLCSHRQRGNGGVRMGHHQTPPVILGAGAEARRQPFLAFQEKPTCTVLDGGSWRGDDDEFRVHVPENTREPGLAVECNPRRTDPGLLGADCNSTAPVSPCSRRPRGPGPLCSQPCWSLACALLHGADRGHWPRRRPGCGSARRLPVALRVGSRSFSQARVSVVRDTRVHPVTVRAFRLFPVGGIMN